MIHQDACGRWEGWFLSRGLAPHRSLGETYVCQNQATRRCPFLFSVLPSPRARHALPGGAPAVAARS